ncbi:Bug family tripartite tricarboxylate transporter substrate binding protein [Ramlibacter sp. MAHUQ-53]|uniref:Bug family tripartite tricarboxylate transporter substrate binding protein n=1 Tax=unclassified Ramlibacter TaxID=2617605 RepID=UPI00362BEB22
MTTSAVPARRSTLRRVAGLLALTLGMPLAASAQASYPERPVRLVVGFAPGGSDISARIVAQKLSQLWGHQVIVDNKPGAAGNIGADIVAKASPDGYTLLLAVNSYTINTVAYKGLSWDLLRDFTPLGRYGHMPLVVVVNEKMPARTLGELVSFAKANPGKLNYGTAGAGTAPHMATEEFSHKVGLSMAHIPYKGSGPSVQALLADEVQLSFGAQSAFDAFIKAGRLRPLAVTTAARQPQLPDVPTIKEATGIDFDADVWYGLLGPAKLPPALAAKISEDLRKVLADPDTQSRLREAGVQPAYLNPADMADLMKRNVATWRSVVSRTKISLD